MARSSLNEKSRERKLAVPTMKDVAAWRRFCLGAYTADEVVTSLPLPAPVTLTTTVDVSSKYKNSTSSSSQRGEEEEVAVNKRKRDLVSSLDTDGANGEGLVTLPIRLEREDVACETEGTAEEEVPIEFDHSAFMEEWAGPKNVAPNNAVLLQFDQVLTQKLLSYHVDWLETSELSPANGGWLYGLLTRLEKPLHRDVVAVIRQLYRRCCYLRKALNVDSPSFDGTLASLNVLIAITGAYFGQGEEYVDLSSALGITASDQEIVSGVLANGAIAFNLNDFASGMGEEEDGDDGNDGEDEDEDSDEDEEVSVDNGEDGDDENWAEDAAEVEIAGKLGGASRSEKSVPEPEDGEIGDEDDDVI